MLTWLRSSKHIFFHPISLKIPSSIKVRYLCERNFLNKLKCNLNTQCGYFEFEKNAENYCFIRF